MRLPEPSPGGDVWFSFLSIVLEGAPYLFFGTLVSGFIDAFLPRQAMDRLLPRRPFFAILAAGLLGSVFPVCECAVVPVIRRLLKKGLPLSCALTYMLAAPILNPIVVLSTLSAFKGQDAVTMTVSRLLIAYIITVVLGLAVSRMKLSRVLLEKAMASGDDGHSHSHGSSGERVRRALGTAMHDFLDTGKYFVIGVLITAFFNARVIVQPGLQDGIATLAGNDFLAIPAMMALAFILSLCSTTDAFIAANMQGFSQASRLAFLVFGPMVDFKLIFMYASVFRKGFVVRLVTAIFLLVGISTWIWKTFIPHGS
jgi:uncharacterized membrane protein YraQ (UPF0718 family)